MLLFLYVTITISVLWVLTQRTLLAIQNARFAHAHNCLPPSAYHHRDPIFGLDLLLRTVRALKTHSVMIDFQSRFRELDTKTYTYVQLGTDMMTTMEPENVRAIWATDFKKWGLSPVRKAAFGVFGHGIFVADGKDWEESRNLLRPNFVRSTISDLPALEVHVQNLISVLPSNGEVVDLEGLYMQLTMDSASEVLFGESTSTLTGNGDAKALKFSQTYDDVSRHMSTSMRIGWIHTLIPNKKNDEGVKYINEFVATYVNKALDLRKELENGSAEKKEPAQHEGRYIMLHELAKTGYGAEKISAELLSIIAAGRETTASLLTIATFMLARYPDVVAKLRAEIAETSGTESPTFEQLTKMKYLNWTLKEVQRVYPVIPINGRMALENTTLPLGGGPDGKSPVFVPKGQIVLANIYGMHHRKDIYGDDDEAFKPERWANLKPGWNYLPFAGGPRVCIGQQMAITEAGYTLVRLLQTFKDISPGDDEGYLEKMTVSMSVEHCNVRLTAV